MAERCVKHEDPTHQNGPSCGHVAIEHNGYTDYLHDGHLHHLHGGHVDEHVIEVNAAHPEGCTQRGGGHDTGHIHGPRCGHPQIPHGSHFDYLVDNHLHHPHGDHCDDHGRIHTLPA